MVMMKNRTQILNVMRQWIALKKAFPASTGGVRRNQLKWMTELQPSSLSDTYDV